MAKSLGEVTVRSRGSQKSSSVSEAIEDRGCGEGEGESEGQALADRRSDA